MNRYAIYCTEEQTLKALRLGAPIERQSAKSNAPIVSCGETRNEYKKKVPILYNIPTAEEMIGWLEEQGCIHEVCMYHASGWSAVVYESNRDSCIGGNSGKSSRKEATIAAIDAALEYLEKLKR